MTQAGTILGTVAYMSPEQARGWPVDKRTDIWAFGCVLYEMLTGTLAFAGETTTDVLSAVLHREPDWGRLPSTLSPRICELLQDCLEKNARDCLRDIADARFEIQRARQTDSPGGRSSGITPARPAPAGRSHTGYRRVSDARACADSLYRTRAVVVVERNPHAPPQRDDMTGRATCG